MIRKAVEKDIDRINELLYQVQKVHSDKRPDIFQDGKKKYNSEQIAEIIKNENTPVFVAVDKNDSVLGYAFCIFESIKNHPSLATRKTLYIDDLCVDKEIRGRKIGTKLYEYVLEFAKENGFEAYVFFIIQMKSCLYFTPNRDTHPEFADTLKLAAEKGVSAVALSCSVAEDSLAVSEKGEIKIII